MLLLFLLACTLQLTNFFCASSLTLHFRLPLLAIAALAYLYFGIGVNFASSFHHPLMSANLNLVSSWVSHVLFFYTFSVSILANSLSAAVTH